MGKALVEVLMSTYNGECYLREQIESILDQEGVEVRLVVRDDGSTDGTREILSGYADDARVSVRCGENLGLPWSFFRLIEDSGADANYWALADQDDVWLPGKLARAVNHLKDLEGPALYCSRVLIVDASLSPLGPHPLPRRGPSFPNALVQNIATGCTMVLNRRARATLVRRWPDYAVMHDAWLYLVVSGVGRVVYDPEVGVLYRQHPGNVVGIGRGRVNRLAGRIRRQLTPGGAGAHGRQNAELLRTHVDLLRPDAVEGLRRFLDSRATFGGRARYAVTGGAHRQTRGSNMVMRVLHALGRA